MLELAKEIAELASHVLLALALIGVFQEWWYPGPMVRRQLKEERDKAEERLKEERQHTAEWKESSRKWEESTMSLLQTAASAARLAESTAERLK